jgi:hypothetical protein
VILLGGSDSGAAIVNLVDLDFLGKPRRRALCGHFAMIEDRRVAGCPKYGCLSSAGGSAIAMATRDRGLGQGASAVSAPLPAPSARRLTIRINRIDPGLFSEAFLSWVRED